MTVAFLSCSFTQLSSYRDYQLALDILFVGISNMRYVFYNVILPEVAPQISCKYHNIVILE